MKVIFGASGQIGTSLLKRLTRDLDEPVANLPWSEIALLSNSELRNRISILTEGQTSSDFIFCNGLTDPKAPKEDLLKSNFEFPKRMIQMEFENSNHRFLTLGTVFEAIPEICATNAYVQSKLRLSEWITHESSLAHRVLHVRLHTIYGGKSGNHLFLGQMLEALRTGHEFKMSSGEQLREYHHVDDLTFALGRLLQKKGPWPFESPILNLSSGRAITLKQIAEAVFKDLGRESLLKVGAIASPQFENRNQMFTASPENVLPASRDPIPHIIDWIRESLGMNPHSTNR